MFYTVFSAFSTAAEYVGKRRFNRADVWPYLAEVGPITLKCLPSSKFMIILLPRHPMLPGSSLAFD